MVSEKEEGYQSHHPVPECVHFSFLARCNMSCPFCYSPFDGKESGCELWKRIIDRILSWEPRAITFSGGDPLNYDAFRTLLKFLRRDRGFASFVQVDTNGLGVKREDIDLLAHTVDLVGLPIDGDTASVHDSLRSYEGHFAVVLKLLDLLRIAHVPVKINTVVTAKNLKDLHRIADLLSRYSVAVWSMYEFWPIGPSSASRNFYAYEVSHPEFLNVCQDIATQCDFTDVEIGTVDSRKGSYFFTSHTGRVFTVERKSPERYFEVGSIFDPRVLSRWAKQADTRQVAERAKQRMDTVKTKSGPSLSP